MNNRLAVIVGSIIAIILTAGFSLWLNAQDSSIRQNTAVLSQMGTDVAVIRSKLDSDDSPPKIARIEQEIDTLRTQIVAMETTLRLHTGDPSIHRAGIARVKEEISELKSRIKELEKRKQ